MIGELEAHEELDRQSNEAAVDPRGAMAGHAFDEANTHIATDGHRTCRACKREADRRRRNPDKPQRTCAKCGGKGHYAITCDVEAAS